jgi:hypothetical protein
MVQYLNRYINDATEVLLYKRNVTQDERIREQTILELCNDILNLPDTLDKYKIPTIEEETRIKRVVEFGPSQAVVMGQTHYETKPEPKKEFGA